MNLSSLRQEYSGQGLHRADLAPDPMAQFDRWFQDAMAAMIPEPNAMSLATVDAEGHPSLRTVLLKSFDAAGLVFFTNYHSRKASEIATKAHVALLFPWIPMERQVIVRGAAGKIAPAESAAYFAVRPRESQIGAWVSHQSSVIPDRASLEEKLAELERRFATGEIPCPPFWGGYRVIPESVEFWQGGHARLHDRFLYQRDGKGWSIERLSP